MPKISRGLSTARFSIAASVVAVLAAGCSGANHTIPILAGLNPSTHVAAGSRAPQYRALNNRELAALRRIRPNQQSTSAYVFQDTGCSDNNASPADLVDFESSNGDVDFNIDCNGDVFVLGSPLQGVPIFTQIGGGGKCCTDGPWGSGYRWMVGNDGTTQGGGYVTIGNGWTAPIGPGGTPNGLLAGVPCNTMMVS